jgi:hypothetical protein
MIAKLTVKASGQTILLHSQIVREAISELDGGTRIYLNEPAPKNQQSSKYRFMVVAEVIDTVNAAFNPPPPPVNP